MKSLNERYSSSQANVYETFADLIFCALVVLVLFVMMLAIEVSQRVRAKIAAVPEVVTVESIQQLSPQEVEELSKKLQRQQSQMNRQRDQMLLQQDEISKLRNAALSQANVVAGKIAALNGEQRFTGATEPASITVCFDYDDQLFYFISSKDMDHADTSLSGESFIESTVRKRKELVALALRARKQRGYSLEEATRLYQAFSQYQEVVPSESSYTIETSKIGLTYSVLLSCYIAGDAEAPTYAEATVVNQILKIYENPGPVSDAMYPAVNVVADVKKKHVQINGVTLAPREFRDLLLSFGGRGAMLDFQGYTGSPPQWLKEEVLNPTGYVGKTPKIPGS